jgi:hypothetical protein
VSTPASRGDDDDELAEVHELPIVQPPPMPLEEIEKLQADSVELGWVARLTIRLLAFVANIPFHIGKLGRRSPVWLWWAIKNPTVGLTRVIGLLFHWLHLSEERGFIRQMENKDLRATKLKDLNKDGRFRIVVAAILTGVALIAHVVLLYAWSGRYAWFVTAEVAGIYGLLWLIGRKPKANADDPVRRRGPLTHGTSSRTLRRDLEEGFAAKKMPDVGVIGMTVNKYGWHGIFETEQNIDDKVIEHLERWVHAPEGALLVSVDPRNAAAHPFKLLIEDPLENPTVPEDVQEPRDIRRLATIGRHLFGKPLLVNLRQHIGLIGRSGSGKSSGFWVLLDWVTSCFNAQAFGIDLSQGPALPAWRRAMIDVATEADKAIEILERAIDEAKRRNSLLAEWAESDDSDHDDENWDPTEQDPAWFIFMDEFHLSADDARILSLTKTGIRIGRKACVFFVFGTPGASKEDVGSVVIKGMIGLKILFACIQQDVTNFLGGKMIEQGWRPDKLRPAAGGVPKDAGKAYVWDGDHQDPEVVRISRLTLPACKQRARARALGGRPTGQEEGPDMVKQRPLPESLALLLEILDDYDLDKVSLDWIDRWLTNCDHEWTLDRLRADLARHMVTPRSVNKGPWREANPRGYHRSQLSWPPA